MKYFILSVFLIAFSSLIGQTFTQKYNSYLNRYEFYNSNGSLIGYKEYNKFLSQWEYFSSEETSRSSYIDPIDHQDMERTMSKLQNNYDNNYIIVTNRVMEIVALADELTRNKDFINSQYNESVLKVFQNLKFLFSKLENENIDFSKKSTGIYLLNQIQPYFNELKYYKLNFEAEKSQLSNISTYSSSSTSPSSSSHSSLNPTTKDANDYYIIAEGFSSNNPSLARKYYKKTLEMNPRHKWANSQLVNIVLREEIIILEEMKTLGKNEIDKKRSEILQKKRLHLYEEALPYVQKAKMEDPSNLRLNNMINRMREMKVL